MSLTDIYHFITKSNYILEQIDSLINDWRCFLKEWEIELNEVEGCETVYKDAKKDIKINLTKLRNDVLKCVVFGRISTGKSALINALLTKEVLPSYDGPTTNSFIEIRASLDESNYVIFPDSSNEKRDISHINVVDESSKAPLAAGSHVDLYYSSKECPLLREGVVIVDTPGIDGDVEMDADIQRECEGADVLILVVSSECGLGECENNFLSKHKSEFSKMNVMIVFNKWERIEDLRLIKTKDKYLKQAAECLLQYFKVTQNDATRWIHFLSATERLNKIAKANVLQRNDLLVRDIRNENFEKFSSHLEEMLSDRTRTRRRLMKEVYNALDATCNQIKLIGNINKKICVKVSENVNKFNSSKGSIVSEIEAAFGVMFEAFFSKSLRVVKVYRDEDESVLEYRLQCIFMEAQTVAVETTKIKIREGVSNSDLPNKDYIMKILEIFYIPFNLNLGKEIELSNMQKERSTFARINQKIKKFTGIAIAGITVGSALALGAAGAMLGVFAPISTAIFTPLFVTLGVGAGGGTAGGLSFRLLKRRALEPRYKEDQKKIEAIWNTVKELVTKSFYELNLDVNERIEELRMPLDDRFTGIKNELIELRNMALIT